MDGDPTTKARPAPFGKLMPQVIRRPTTAAPTPVLVRPASDAHPSAPLATPPAPVPPPAARPRPIQPFGASAFRRPGAAPVAPAPTPTPQRPAAPGQVIAPPPARSGRSPFPPAIARPRPVAAAAAATSPLPFPVPASRPAAKPVGPVMAGRSGVTVSLPLADLPDDEPDDDGNFERVNATQVRYRPVSRVNPTGAVAPATMAAATYRALEALETRVGDLDEWVRLRLRWTREELGGYLTSEQVDGVALALDTADRNEGFIVADQTGFGKGRILAATARAMALSGLPVVFLTEKANLFSDFWRDVRDIASEEVFGRPFMLNDDATIVDTSSEEGRVLVPKWKKAEVDRVLREGKLPHGSRLLMATYSQFNRKGTRKVDLLTAVAREGHVELDEAHNFVGADSTTSRTVGDAVRAARSSTFSSATFARDVTNLASYSSVFPWLSSVPGLSEMSPAHRRALAEESVRLATQSGRIIRREHDLTNMVLRMSTAEGQRLARNEALADRLAPILSRMAKLARRVDAILMERNETNKQYVEGLPSAEERKAERELWITANFGSRLSAILQQFLVALNVEAAAEMCIASLRDGQKPVVVIESTMESLMRELARDGDVAAGEPDAAEAEPDPQGALDLGSASPEAEEEDTARPAAEPRPPTFREALTLLAERLLVVGVRKGGSQEKERVFLSDPSLVEARDEILSLVERFPDLSLSPIDDLRDAVEAEGRRLHAAGIIPRPWVADEISARGMRVVDGRYVTMPGVDRNQIVARFVNGATSMLVLTQAASTGLSIHDSEKFLDHARRHMIELSPPRNVLARIQMWGRVWRRGQLTEPLFSVLDTGLPFHSYDLGARNRKLRELSASVTGTSRATVSLDVPDPMDPVGNEVAHEFLQEQQQLAETMGISLNVDKDEADRELYFVGKLFRRLPLLPRDMQARVCTAFYAAYEDRIRNGADAQSGKHLEGRWTPVRREVLEAGDGSSDPVNGGDVHVTTLRSERDARPLGTAEVAALVAASRAHLPGGRPFAAHIERLREKRAEILQAALPRKRFASVSLALGSSEDNPVKRADTRLKDMVSILSEIRPGLAARLPAEDGEVIDGLVVDVRPPPPERASLAREYEIAFVVPGDEKPRTVSLDAMIRDRRTTVATAERSQALLAACDAAPKGRVSVERKVIDGSGIGAVMASIRMGSGTRVTYADARGRMRNGILLPRSMERRVASTKGRTHLPVVAARVLASGGRLQTNPVKPGQGVELRPEPGGGAKVVIPPTKRDAKPFETAEMLALTGEFTGDWRERDARVPAERVLAVLELLARTGNDFHFDATHRGEAIELTRELARTDAPACMAPSPRG